MISRAVARYETGGATGADSELLARHGPLLDRCARRLAARTGWAVQPEDLWAAGAMGLLEAARRFDTARDVRFETFAEHRIRGAMLDELRRMDHLPRRLRADVEKVSTARSRLQQRLGREPEVDDVARAAGVEVEQAAELLHLLEPVLPADERLESVQPGAEDAVASSQERRLLVEAISALPERLQLLLALHYDEELTYREIAKILGVSEPRVCQLHSEAVRKLKEGLAARL